MKGLIPPGGDYQKETVGAKGNTLTETDKLDKELHMFSLGQSRRAAGLVSTYG